MTVRQHEWVQAEPTFRILGPVQMARDGVRVELGGRQPRSVLAILLLDANRPVSTDRLKEGLWGDHWPDGAANALQAFVSRLRRALAASAQQEPATIVTVPGGYRLQVASESVDLHRFTNLVDAARAAR